MAINSLATLPLIQLKRAVSIREQIESLETELNQLLCASASAATNGVSHFKSGLNASARQVQWSRFNGARGVRSDVLSGTQRLSPQGRAKISAVVTARWEKYRAAKARLSRAS